ncbi:MAG: response regulator [Gammaproteobacteria bacterium]
MDCPTLLIVDDSAVIRHTIRKSLRRRFPHFRFVVAANGREAQHQIEQRRFHLVLCDWEMPEMCGDELLIWLRNHPQHRQTPFIMVTSRTDPSWVSQAARLGVNDYLGKPFSLDRLAEMTAIELLKYGVDESTLRLEAAGLSHLQGNKLRGLDPVKATHASRSGSLSRDRFVSAQPPASLLEHRNRHLNAAFSRARIYPVEGLVPVWLKSGGTRVRCLIEHLGTRAASVTVPGDQPIPDPFDAVVLEIEIPGQSRRLHVNAFLVGHGQVEPRPGLQLRSADLVFVDDDGGKLGELRRIRSAICRFEPDAEHGSCEESGEHHYDFSALSTDDSVVI